MHLMCFRTRFFIFSHLTRDRTAFPGRHDILSFYLDQVITTYEICLRSMDHVIEMAGIGTWIISFLFSFQPYISCRFFLRMGKPKGQMSWSIRRAFFFFLCCMILTLPSALFYFILCILDFTLCTCCAPALIAFLRHRVFYIFVTVYLSH